MHQNVSAQGTGAQLGYFKGRGFVVEVRHKYIGFQTETFRAIA